MAWFPWPWSCYWCLWYICLCIVWRWVQVQPRKVFIVKYWCLTLQNPFWCWIEVTQDNVACFKGFIQQLIALQPKVVLNKNYVIQPLLLQTVPLFNVYTLKHTPIPLTPWSTTCLAQDSNCKFLQLRPFTTKLLPPIGYKKSGRKKKY